jgi:soluble lytic murein transglycosylase-like protein
LPEEVDMSIKINSFASQPPRRTDEHKPSATGFEDQLRRLLSDRAGPEAAARQARLQIHRCQLAMTRSLLADPAEDSARNLSPLLPSCDAWPAATPTGGQKLDICPTIDGAVTAARAGQQPNAPDVEGIIQQAAARHDVDPGLIRAVIRTESAFDARAVSPAGAQGLMQLMPDTASELGVTDPFDAEQNVMAGTRYLRQLLDRYHGDLDHALAAYNWGMGNVDRHGLASLPEETRQYLVRVKQA